jgi:hypothetical protein
MATVNCRPCGYEIAVLQHGISVFLLLFPLMFNLPR